MLLIFSLSLQDRLDTVRGHKSGGGGRRSDGFGLGIPPRANGATNAIDKTG